MILTNDKKIYEKCKSLRNLCFGSGDHRFNHNDIGWNYRMTNLSAAVGLAQLERIDEIVEKKEVILQKYKKYLVKAPLKFQVSQPWAKPVNWLTSVVLTSSAPISASR